MHDEDVNRSIADIAIRKKRAREIRSLALELGVSKVHWPLFREIVVSHAPKQQAWIVRRLQQNQPHWFNHGPQNCNQ